MFGDLDKYSDETFSENTTGKIYLPDRVLYLETAAFLTVDAYDKYIYRTQWDNVSERQELLKRIYEQAQYTTGEETYDGRSDGSTVDLFHKRNKCKTCSRMQDCAQQCFGGRKWKSICGDGK